MAAEVVEKGIVLKAQGGRLVVGVKRAARNTKYGRVSEKVTKLYANDMKHLANVGDTVIVRFSRPISSSKRWQLLEVVTKTEAHSQEAKDA